jgi:hypothetical protein
MSIPKTELDVIAERCRRARPATWETERNNFVNPELISDQCRIVWSEHSDIAYITAGGIDNGNADADFIAHARQDVPRLIQEIDRLRKKLSAHGIKPD